MTRLPRYSSPECSGSPLLSRPPSTRRIKVAGIAIGLSLPGDSTLTKRAIYLAVETLVTANLDYLIKHPRTLPLTRCGIRYQREYSSPEQWQGIADMLRTKRGDCEDLSAWRCAELRYRGYRAVPHVIGKRGKWHIQVKLLAKDKRDRRFAILDPSKELGM